MKEDKKPCVFDDCTEEALPSFDWCRKHVSAICADPRCVRHATYQCGCCKRYFCAVHKKGHPAHE